MEKKNQTLSFVYIALSLYKGYMVLKFLQELTWAHRGLHGLQEVTNVTRGYRGLQRLQGIIAKLINYGKRSARAGY